MADQLSLRGGTTSEHAAFTGANKEVTVDTTKKTLVVNDGATVGGHPLMRENASNSALALGSAATPSLKFTGDPNTGIYSPGADQVAISTGGSGRLFVDASGRVGVGTSSPSSPLHVYAVGNTEILIGGTSTPILNLIGGAATDPVIGYGVGALRFGTTTGAGAAGFSEKIRFDTSGRVGIGTSAPSQLLTTVGNIKIAGAQASNIAKLCLTRTDTSWSINNETDLRFYYGNSDTDSPSTLPVVFTSTGRVGVGTASPAQALSVVGNIVADGSAASQYVASSKAGVTSTYLMTDANGGNIQTDGAWPIRFTINSSERARIDSSGRLLVGTSSEPNTGGTLCVNNGIGIVNNTTNRFATVEHGDGASGAFTTITISATVQSTNGSVIFETLMTGFSGVYLDNVSARYSNQAAVTMRNNASAGTSAALTVNGAGTTYTLTITTSVDHPVVKVKVTAGGLVGDITLPTITFA